MDDHICDKCNAKFKTNRNLRRHLDNNSCKKKEFVCPHCDKEFSMKNSMYRHMKHTCKENTKLDSVDFADANQENDYVSQIYEMLIKLKEENNTLKKKMNKMAKGKVINNNTTTTNNNCNINNGTVNNIYLVGYGKEDMTKIDYNELLKGFKSGFHSTLTLLDTVHFNPKYPEFHNIYISSMKNKYAMMYDGDNWTLVMKDELIDKLYDDKRNYIDENLDDFLDSLTVSQKTALNRWMDTDDDYPYIKKIKNDIKLLLYNKRNLAINNKNANRIDDQEDPIPQIIEIPKNNIKVLKQSKKNIDADIKNLDNESNSKHQVLNVKRKKNMLSKPAGRPGTKAKRMTKIL